MALLEFGDRLRVHDATSTEQRTDHLLNCHSAVDCSRWLRKSTIAVTRDSLLLSLGPTSPPHRKRERSSALSLIEVLGRLTFPTWADSLLAALHPPLDSISTRVILHIHLLTLALLAMATTTR